MNAAGNVGSPALRGMPPLAIGLGALALAAFELRDHVRFDPNFIDPDVALEWFTFPKGLWLPLTAAASAWLSRHRRDTWSALPVPRHAVGLAVGLAVLAVATSLWARLTGVSDVLLFSLVAGAAALAARKGLAGLRVQAVPLLFLLFAMPPPPRLVNEAFWWIQSGSARAATVLVRATGMPILEQGIVLSTPDEVFGIVESCAALGILVVLTAMAVLMREGVTYRGPRSWLLVALAPLVALLLNLGRITVIVLEPTINELHHVGQWSALLVLGALVLSFAARALHAEPTDRSVAEETGRPVRVRGLAATALAIALAVASTNAVPAPSTKAGGSRELASVPRSLAGWVSNDVAIDHAFLGFVRYREWLARTYRRDDEVVDLFVGVASPRSEWSSPFSPKTILPGAGWVPVARTELGEALGWPLPPSETALVSSRVGVRWLVLQWRIGDPGVLPESLRQLVALDASPFGPPIDRRVIRIAAPIRPGSSDAREARDTLGAFLRDFGALVLPGLDDRDSA